MIGGKEIQDFAGALATGQSTKGVFITTSDFGTPARERVDDLSASFTIILINGEQLAKYIYDYGVGMQVEQTLEIKKLDSDFWDDMQDENV